MESASPETKKSARFCRATPPGRGAIATTILFGANSLEILNKFFKANRGGQTRGLQPGLVRYGFWQSNADSPPEDVVISVDDRCQISVHSHGGLISQHTIAEDLARAGALEIAPSEFSKNESSDFWNWQIRLALQNAPTEFAALALVDQFSAWAAFNKQIVAQIESGDFDGAAKEINSVIQRWPLGRHLIEPWSVVICGAPNVGKSSLINAILGFERVIVSPTPGTTRDVVRQTTAIGGWPFVFADTAGIRDSTDAIEKTGIEMGLAQITAADCVVAVFDASRPWQASDSEFVQKMKPQIVVFNKNDIAIKDLNRSEGISLSATTGSNVDLLLAKVLESVVPPNFDSNKPLAVTKPMLDRLESLLKAVANREVESTIELLTNNSQPVSSREE